MGKVNVRVLFMLCPFLVGKEDGVVRQLQGKDFADGLHPQKGRKLEQGPVPVVKTEGDFVDALTVHGREFNASFDEMAGGFDDTPNQSPVFSFHGMAEESDGGGAAAGGSDVSSAGCEIASTLLQG